MPKPKCRARGDLGLLALPEEIASLRSVNGSASWLSKETRPDLAAQVSLSQQSLSNPTGGRVRQAADTARRAHQFSGLVWTIPAIPKDRSSLRNGRVGYIIGVADLKRTIGSTLATEAQIFVDGLGQLEWIVCMYMYQEAYVGHFSLRERGTMLCQMRTLAVTGCKSLYAHIISPGSPSGVQDKRCAVDLVIARESMSRVATSMRWAPTDRQLADCLTKNAAEPTDLLRVAMRSCRYQIADEPGVLQAAAAERARRKAIGVSRRASVAQTMCVLAAGSRCCGDGAGAIHQPGVRREVPGRRWTPERASIASWEFAAWSRRRCSWASMRRMSI